MQQDRELSPQQTRLDELLDPYRGRTAPWPGPSPDEARDTLFCRDPDGNERKHAFERAASVLGAVANGAAWTGGRMADAASALMDDRRSRRDESAARFHNVGWLDRKIGKALGLAFVALYGATSVGVAYGAAVIAEHNEVDGAGTVANAMESSAGWTYDFLAGNAAPPARAGLEKVEYGEGVFDPVREVVKRVLCYGDEWGNHPGVDVELEIVDRHRDGAPIYRWRHYIKEGWMEDSYGCIVEIPTEDS